MLHFSWNDKQPLSRQMITRGTPFPANDSQRQCHRPIIEQHLAPRDKKITWVECNVGSFFPQKSSFSYMKEELQATFLNEEKQKVFGDKFACWSCTSWKMTNFGAVQWPLSRKKCKCFFFTHCAKLCTPRRSLHNSTACQKNCVSSN